MKNVWTKKWKSLLIWISAYVSFIAYALIGGYVIAKSDDEELQRTAKQAFVVTIIFTAVSAFLSLFNYIGSFVNNYYASGAYEFYSTFSSLVGIAKIIVFTTFSILALMQKEESNEPKENDTNDK